MFNFFRFRSPEAQARYEETTDPFPNLRQEPSARHLLVQEQLAEAGVEIAHFRASGQGHLLNPKHTATVVFRPRRSVDHALEVATSLIDERHDTFSKRVGRELALDRWTSGHRSFLPARANLTDRQLLRLYFGQIG